MPGVQHTRAVVRIDAALIIIITISTTVCEFLKEELKCVWVLNPRRRHA